MNTFPNLLIFWHLFLLTAFAVNDTDLLAPWLLIKWRQMLLKEIGTKRLKDQGPYSRRYSFFITYKYFLLLWHIFKCTKHYRNMCCYSQNLLQLSFNQSKITLRVILKHYLFCHRDTTILNDCKKFVTSFEYQFTPFNLFVLFSIDTICRQTIRILLHHDFYSNEQKLGII